MDLTKYDQDGLHHWAPQRKPGGGWKCFKSSPKAPQAPDPVKTAAAQTSSNIDTANAQAALNRNNQVTPWGTQSWTQGPRNPDGTSSWTSTISLDPAQQKLLESDNQISQMMANLGIKQAGNVSDAISKPINYDSLPTVYNAYAQGNISQKNIPGMQTNVGYGRIQDDVNMSGVDKLVGGDALAKAMQDNQDAAYRQQAGYLDTRYGQGQSDLENKLIQQGVTQNSDAWNRAMNNFGQQRTFDYNNAFNNSFAQGLTANNQLYNQGLSTNQNQYGQALGNAQFHNSAQQQGFGQALANAQLNNSVSSDMFGRGLASAELGNKASAQNFSQSSAQRAQALQELMQQQQNPINVLNALRSGSQVSAPQFGQTPQGSIANTDIAGMYNNQYQGQLGAYNSKVSQNNALMGQLGTLGNMAMAAYPSMAALFSDRRLKKNVRQIGMHRLGIGLYAYDYIWGEPGFGVMADELEQVLPDAVSVHPSGFKMVNYGML